jgi:hypothetical protein
MQDINIMFEPLRGLLQQVGGFLPRLLIALGVLLLGWLIAKAVRLALVKTLRALNLHVLSERSGIDDFLRGGGSQQDTTALIGWLGYALVVLASLMIAGNSLGLAQVTELLGKVVFFVPRLLVALLVLLFGGYFARFVGAAVLGYCKRVALGDAELLARLARYTILTFVVLLAIDQLDFGGGLIQQTFLILLAGVVFGTALALGLGARDRAADLIDRWFPRDRAMPAVKSSEAGRS